MNDLSDMKWFVRIGWGIIIVFLFTYIFTAFFNVPASDDFYLKWLINRSGIWGAYDLLLTHANSRYIALWLMLWLIDMQQNTLWFYPVFSLAILFLAFFSVRLYIHAYFKLANRNLNQLNFISLLCIAFLFYSTPAIGESWFWISSASVYIIPVFVSLAGFAFLLLSTEKKAYVILAVVAFIYAGLSSEIFLPLNLFILITLKAKKNNNISVITMVFSCIFILIPAFFLFSGSGFIQRNSEPVIYSWVESLLVNFKLLGILVFKLIVPVLAFLIIALLSIMYYFNRYNLVSDIQINKHRQWYGFLFGMLLIFLFQMIFTVKFGDPMPGRVCLPFMFSLMLIAFPLVYIWTRKWVIRNSRLIKMFLCFFLLLQIIFSVVNLSKTLLYVDAYAKRSEYLNKNRDSNNQLQIPKLPSSGFLYTAEITTDSSNYRNIHIKLAYDLKKSPIINP